MNLHEISVVIPALNAAAALPATLAALGGVGEVIVADGGSHDGTVSTAEARVIAAPRGRGSQIAAGIKASSRPWLLLLHADTRLAPGWQEAASCHMAVRPGHAGYFRLRFDSADPRARWIEQMAAWRCRVFALPYGDQGLLIPRDLLDEVGGMRAIPLMEDVDLVRRLGRARLVPLDAYAVTSAVRYERQGWLRRPLRNLFCLSLYFIGVQPRLIARLYA
ncbi:MAG: TIGR04283 family arsenosugar biosynthesis glycosyltransferase [Alphaproteobacteria bacterium]|nr:TIGR04283 family arsenosugar biosynthesis glycosyltransferase [Alphaproteobacteria bacterium]